ncbi:MAG: pyruvate:ferredoxin (flavodoxin) oxidoreductase [Anaerovoracaceae bacterium]
MSKIMKIVDGNEAAAYVAYPFTEVAGIYPITPSSPMAEKTDEWSANGLKNIFGQKVRLVEMQSEAGAAGAVHGALETGALATTYTASQGLMLMIPTMHRISGQRHPGVLHVASRTIGTHAFSIFGDHSDVMNCRQTGFSMLCSGSVQEIMDLGGIAHLAAIKGRIPFLHWFDGFRTSHEIQKVEALEYSDFAKLVDYEELQKFRDNAINPEDPTMRSTVQNPDIYFQVREANNKDYDAIPEIVQDYMDEIAKLTGRQYHLFDYFGAEDAENVIIAMGSVCGTAEEVIKSLNEQGEKVGLIQVHLYRPFSKEHLFKAVPKSCKRIAVLDRLKEAGAIGDPLYEDVCTAYVNDKERPEIYAGRYGLSSKDTDPACIKAVFDNLKLETPRDHFTIGINDDVTNLSLPIGEPLEVEPEGTISCKFWGLGSDGTVGANKNSIKIIGEQTDMYCQAYFEYDTKKSFGITKSHLRFGDKPISSTYLVKKANFVACHNQNYLTQYDIITEIKKGGTFLLNCDWTVDELEAKVPAHIRRFIAQNDIKFYIINANKCSQEIGLGNRSNMVLQAAFFNLAKVIPVEDAVMHMKAAVKKTYAKKGDKIVNMNIDAIDAGLNAVVQVEVPASWKDAVDEEKVADTKELPSIIKDVLIPINAQKGDDLPVSTFLNQKDGTLPLGTSAYEKRGIATDLPVWDSTKCIQCNQCSFVCPHGVVRPFLLDDAEAKNAPEGFEMADAKGKGLEEYKYAIQVSTLDCTSCGACATTCPKSGEALKMVKAHEVSTEQTNWEYAMTIKEKKDAADKFSVKGSQFRQPLLEFSGACAGCGETPYIKLLTQLYGDKMYIANGTGCTQAWGAAMPCMPYCKNQEGKGPAWSNSLFENNAEFSYGMCLSVAHQRENVKMDVLALVELVGKDSEIGKIVDRWLEAYDDLDVSALETKALISALETIKLEGEAKKLADTILVKKNHLAKKTMWMVGGDGWAYDIGYGGLDHVFAMDEDVNVLVVDTEVYSNTGGQSSKATPVGAVAQFQAAGKKTRKKDLGLLMMSYNNVYVAQCAMGANPNQLMKAIKEAEAHKGPSIVIVYAPCITHGIKKGMNDAQSEMKDAVDSGYWNLYRWNPDVQEFHLDSKEPSKDFKEFLRGEVRYSALDITFPENAKILFEEAELAAKEKFNHYKNLARKMED